MNKLCARCGKPVYFAERKVSLGKEWHPSCLQCVKCGKVLAPGQHAEHKGAPYCHNPCYRALFGPSILGYGSNISSPANFTCSDKPATHAYGAGNGNKTEIFSYRKNHVTKSANRDRRSPRSKSKRKDLTPEMREVLQKIEEFNKFHEGKIRHQMTADERDDGNVDVKGPLRIYWGLSRPIQLVHCDDIPPPPISQWRHSLCVNASAADIPENKLASTVDFGRSVSASHKTRDMDDILLSPSGNDDVVRRKRPGVRKFKTVAYRGDQPTKWKRASINGHIFNYDTSVFTPVLGSCTSVTVDGTMDSSDVIEALLDKFKVQNSPDEYLLYIVNDEGERLLTRQDKPLMERLKLGPDESIGKIFIKEKEMMEEAVPSGVIVQLPIVESAEEENLPHEVEQLLVLPEAVLRGIMAKFLRDEESEVSLVKARYEAARKRIRQRMNDMMSHETSSSA
ncbi:ras association domain-containing protein 2 [Aplysia californica]|uniref:Ras association domain-containing protein 2 n=1 Tax=Aplysia californica TaxID=6500 RepID=A0ABM1A1X0_APLCA|nr:ras association domain-containing protein 2 [Aplysia californica]